MKPKILVVDDQAEIREMLSQVLTEQGYETVTAESGEEGLLDTGENEFALVIADINMPGMDGVTMLENIRKTDPDMEAIVLTGFGTMETAVKSLKCGAIDFLRKPVSLGGLLAGVKKAVGRYHQKKISALSGTAVPISLVLDESLNIRKLNALAQNYLGYTEEELVGAPAQKIFGREFWTSAWGDFIKNPKAEDFPVTLQTSHEITLEIFFTGTIVKNDRRGLVFLGVGKKRPHAPSVKP